jgi:hypothetical protein
MGQTALDKLIFSYIFKSTQAEAAINRLISSFARFQKTQMRTEKASERLAQRMASSYDYASTIMNKKANNQLNAMGQHYQNVEQQMKSAARPVADNIRSHSELGMTGQQAADQIINKQKSMNNYWEQYFANSQNATKQTNKTTNSIGRMGSAMSGVQFAMMSVGLSMLFTGMAIKRFFQNILQSMLSLFMKIEGEQGALSEKVNMLKARLYSMIYGVVDAADSEGIFDTWIDRINSLINYVEEMDDKGKAALVNFSIWGVIIGSVMMVAGQAMLGFIPIILLAGQVGWLAMGKFVIAIGLVVGAISLLTSTIDSDSSSWNKAFKSLFIIAGAVAIAIAVGFAPITIILSVIIGVVYLLFRQFGSLHDVLIGLGLAFGQVGAAILDAIKFSLLWPLQMSIKTVNFLIRAWRRLQIARGKDPGVRELETPKWLDIGGLSMGVWEKRNKFLKQQAEERAMVGSGLYKEDWLTGKITRATGQDNGLYKEDWLTGKITRATGQDNVPISTGTENIQEQIKNGMMTQEDVQKLIDNIPKGNTYHAQFNVEGSTDPEEVARKVLEKQNETMDMFQGSMDS